jgi:signal transduction histidine kinase
MWPAKYFKSRAARLAAFYAIFLVISFALLGGLTIFLVNTELGIQFDQRISAEMDRLKDIQKTKGTEALLDILKSQETTEKTLLYRYESDAHDIIVGNFKLDIPRLGWVDLNSELTSEQEQPDRFRVFTTAVEGGRLSIASDVDEIENVRDTLAGAFSVAGLAAALLALLGGLWLSRTELKNINQLADTAEAITAGALNQRMPAIENGDGFDRLAVTLNTMLDRNAELLNAQIRVTSDIAHDIRTPLTRLRQNLELNGNAEALKEADRLLNILNSLLRIAELEEGARHSNFERVDLSALATQMADAYSSTFEEMGRDLKVIATTPVWCDGDKTLLLQLMSNLFENILAHTPVGTKSILSVEVTALGHRISMADDGPGVPEGEIAKIFRRFTRADTSRITKGNGLGLALVSAIAHLHGAKVSAANLRPGLRINVIWTIKKPEQSAVRAQLLL